MKLILIFICLSFSLSSFASHHFQCYKKIGLNQFDGTMQILMPNLADLTSGASLNSSKNESLLEDFTFVESGKRWIQMQGINGETLKIQSHGNQRLMRITRNDKDAEIFKCFIESSI